MPNEISPAFFSYSRQDLDFALRLANDLRAAGAAVWLDQLDIRPGQRWDIEIAEALSNCPTMLLILSPAAVESTNVTDEVSFALEECKLLIPVLYRDCKIPFRLLRIQYVDARTDYERCLKNLLRIFRMPEAPSQVSQPAGPMLARGASVDPPSARDQIGEPQADATLLATEPDESVQSLEGAGDDIQAACQAYDQSSKTSGRKFRHEGAVNAVAFSPDGKLVATGSEDSSARVFESATSREVSRFMHQSYPVKAVAFGRDGKLVATGSADRTAHVFEANTGREVSRLAHEGPVKVIAFSPDGKLVMTGSDDNTARVFEATTGNEVSRIEATGGYLPPFVHQRPVKAIAFSSDGKFVVIGSGGGGLWYNSPCAWLFEAATGREVLCLAYQNSAIGAWWRSVNQGFTLDDRAITAVAFSPDGRLVVSGSDDNTARVFETTTGREVSRLVHQDSVIEVGFCPYGKLVATASRDHTARVFEGRTGREVSRLAHEGPVNVVAFSPHGKLVMTGSDDNTARVFEATTGNEVFRFVHQGPVKTIAFSSDGKLVATGSDDKTAQVFDTTARAGVSARS